MIAIVTDSTCDLPEEAGQEAGIHVIPAYINIGQQTLRDGVDLAREAFYEMLPSLPTSPTTSAPSPADFVELYEPLLRKASHIVSIHAASKLSGIYNAACLAAQEIVGKRIHVVDSGQVSMGLGWAALAAAKAVRDNMSLEGVLHTVHDTLERVRVYAIFDTLEYLRHSGRVSMVQLGLSTLLSIKPMLELRDGIITSLGRIRTWSRAVNELANRARSLAPVEQLAVMHSNAVECAQSFAGRIKDICPKPGNTIITNVTTVIGSHVGPHALGVAVVIGKATR